MKPQDRVSLLAELKQCCKRVLSYSFDFTGASETWMPVWEERSGWMEKVNVMASKTGPLQGKEAPAGDPALREITNEVVQLLRMLQAENTRLFSEMSACRDEVRKKLLGLSNSRRAVASYIQQS